MRTRQPPYRQAGRRTYTSVLSTFRKAFAKSFSEHIQVIATIFDTEGASAKWQPSRPFPANQSSANSNVVLRARSLTVEVSGSTDPVQ